MSFFFYEHINIFSWYVRHADTMTFFSLYCDTLLLLLELKARADSYFFISQCLSGGLAHIWIIHWKMSELPELLFQCYQADWRMLRVHSVYLWVYRVLTVCQIHIHRKPALSWVNNKTDNFHIFPADYRFYFTCEHTHTHTINKWSLSSIQTFADGIFLMK